MNIGESHTNLSCAVEAFPLEYEAVISTFHMAQAYQNNLLDHMSYKAQAFSL